MRKVLYIPKATSAPPLAGITGNIQLDSWGTLFSDKAKRLTNEPQCDFWDLKYPFFGSFFFKGKNRRLLKVDTYWHEPLLSGTAQPCSFRWSYPQVYASFFHPYPSPISKFSAMFAVVVVLWMKS